MLDEHGLGHQRIKPHCPEENGLIERSNRTLCEALEGEELTDLWQARDVVARIVRWYNQRRPHGDLRPTEGGDPLVPAEVYAGGRTIEIPRWQSWARAAQAKLEELLNAACGHSGPKFRRPPADESGALIAAPGTPG